MLKKILYCGLLGLFGIQVGVAEADVTTSLFDGSVIPNGTYDTFVPPERFWWGGDSINTGINWLAVGAKISSVTQPHRAGFAGSYVPHTGIWRLRLSMCHASGPSVCKASERYNFLDSETQRLESSQEIVEQQPMLRFTSGTSIPGGTSMCYSFVDELGEEYHTSYGMFCQDTKALPDNAVKCTIVNDVLNVALGNIERATIPTDYHSATPENKTAQVQCSGDSSVTYTIKFDYSPVSASGIESIKTGSNGLSVVVLLDDEPKGPASAPVTKTFETGTSDISLGFVAVRDPSVSISDIPTGDFSASATMIMTEQ